MTRSGLMMILGLFILSGCGAPAATSSIDETLDANPTPAPAPAAAPAGTTETKTDEAAPDTTPPEDKTATQAALYCQNEIKKTGLQAVPALDQKQVQACLIGIRPEIKKECSQGVKKELIFKIIVNKDGSVGGAFAIGDGADSPEAACISEKVKKVMFPKFSSTETQVIEKYPFQVE